MVLADGQGVDADATREKRAALRGERQAAVSRAPGVSEAPVAGTDTVRHPLQESLDICDVGGQSWVRCTRCGHVLCESDKDWRRRLRRGRRPAHPSRPAHGPARRPVRVPALVLPRLQRPAQFGDRGGGGAAGVRRRSGVLRRRSGAASFRQAPGEGVVGEGFKLGCVAWVLQFSAGNYLNINDKNCPSEESYCSSRETINTKTTPRTDRDAGHLAGFGIRVHVTGRKVYAVQSRGAGLPVSVDAARRRGDTAEAVGVGRIAHRACPE